MRRRWWVLGGCWVGLAVVTAACRPDPRGEGAAAPAQSRWRLTEAAARAAWRRDHPGEQLLNDAIGRAAVRLSRERPMGRFVLGLTTPGNDCSDFVACCIDDGLGVQARFRRGSQQHLLAARRGLFEHSWWRPGVVLLPGDELSVRHSPHYQPYPEACWHTGLIGSDGQVYDFSKLKRWPTARYGRHPVAWFLRHSRGHHEVLLSRLHWRYRYRVEPLPRVTG
ncbi:MAG: hypothetical protein IT204_10825 [Fimbriimonadaceae bacterium]|nr:hypothetical protein [Fimbriimonadaceae bacterium]